MVDKSSQAEIQGIDIDKLSKGFADEEIVFKKFVINSTTKAREIRWYKKTAGYLDTATTTGITGTLISNVASKARPFVTEQGWTRQTSYIRKYMVESPWLSDEDLKDSDVDILATNVRDLVRAVARKVDIRIWDVITESQTPVNINTAAATGTGWDDTTNGNPILDILTGLKNIRSYSYNPNGCVLAMNPIEHMHLINYLITVKGSSIPNFSSQQLKKSVVMEILGCNVLVSQNATTDYAAMWIPDTSAKWKSFTPITSTVITDEGIGKKIRVWESGECLLEHPRSVHLITDTIT